MNRSELPLSPRLPDIGFREFVALMATIMALNALAIDTMLPALPAIAQSLSMDHANQSQWVISAYLLGYAAGQLVYGPMSDRYGRRGILLVCLGAYALLSFFAGFTTSMTGMLIARALQGLATAGARVLAVAIVRDRYSGAPMARVMSLTFIVFLLVPILAPSLGQLILQVAPWPFIFHVLALCAVAVLVWSYFRLRETLHPEYRRSVSVRQLAQAWKFVLGNRVAMGYTLASMFFISALFGFINSIQQIYTDIFHAPHRFPLMFAVVAGMMAVSALLNSRIVERVGMHRVSHTAAILYVVFAGAHAWIAWTGQETEVIFVALQACIMSCFSLATSNFSAIAMEPLGAVAGSASSLQGFITTFGGALLGLVVSQHYDQTTIPLTLGFFGFGLAGLIIVLVTESGRLFAAPPKESAEHPGAAH